MSRKVDFDKKRDSEGYPMLHHSPVFQAVYVARFFLRFTTVVAIPFIVFNFSQSIVPFFRILAMLFVTESIYGLFKEN